MSGSYTKNRLRVLLDPEKTGKDIVEPNVLARQTFPLKSNRAESLQEMIAILVAYVIHHMRFVLGGPDMPEDLALAEVQEALRTKRMTIEDVYDDVRRGTNQGIAGVLDLISKYFQDRMIAARTEWAINQEINDQLDFEEVREVVASFLDDYKSLPFEFRTPEAVMGRDWKRFVISVIQMEAQQLRSQIGKLP